MGECFFGLLEVLPDPVLVAGEDELIRCGNGAAAGFLCAAPESLAGLSLQELLPARDRAGPRLGAELLARAGLPVHHTLLRRDGVEVEAELVGHATEVEGKSGIVFSLRRSHQLRDPVQQGAPAESQRLVFENAPLGILHYDARGVITACNERFEAIIGASRRQLIGLAMQTLPDERIVACVRTALAGTTARFEGDYRSATAGKVTPVRLSFTPITGEQGEVIGGVGLVEDVTEQARAAGALRELSTRLARADRMASLGTLAAGVAHEANTPLAYVLTSLELAEREAAALRPGVAPEAPAGASWAGLSAALANAREGAERVNLLMRDLRAFSRDQKEAREEVDVEKVLDGATKLAGNEILHRARLVKEYAGVPRLLASEARLTQVFLNMLVNAAQAIPEGHAAEHEIRLVTRSAAGKVIVEVRDSGAGIAAPKLERIFEPFFTDKPGGSGLGLSICHGIVHGLGGEIEVESAPGKGSCFRVSLPLGEALAPAAVPPPAVARPATGRGRVLVVDDAARLGWSLRYGLGEQHDVVTTTSGREALALLATDDAFDVVLCDLMMPELSGMDLFEEVQRTRPGLAERFIFMSGGAFTERARSFLRSTPNRRLEKPFRLEELERLIAEQLARGGAHGVRP